MRVAREFCSVRNTCLVHWCVIIAFFWLSIGLGFVACMNSGDQLHPFCTTDPSVHLFPKIVLFLALGMFVILCVGFVVWAIGMIIYCGMEAWDEADKRTKKRTCLAQAQ